MPRWGIMKGRRCVRSRAPHKIQVSVVVGMLAMLAALTRILPEVEGCFSHKLKLTPDSGCPKTDLAFAGLGVRAVVPGSRHRLTTMRAAESKKDALGQGKVRYVKSEEDEKENKDLPLQLAVALGLVALAGGYLLLSKGADTDLFVLVVLLTAICGAASLAIGGLILVTKVTSPPEEAEEDEAVESQEAA
mmetsp:Transcript_112813/g.224416  ORF Transcript_112813/g.224416 Transcript_112813/m.224416 type:complete len:190 (+) Transcript_112813:75-644(+)